MGGEVSKALAVVLQVPLHVQEGVVDDGGTELQSRSSSGLQATVLVNTLGM